MGWVYRTFKTGCRIFGLMFLKSVKIHLVFFEVEVNFEVTNRKPLCYPVSLEHHSSNVILTCFLEREKKLRTLTVHKKHKYLFTVSSARCEYLVK
jgi:hypothetical protein